jgi:hypothetical protein
MTEALCSIYTESPTEVISPYYSENILSTFSTENITESINNNTLISSINSIVTFQNTIKQESTCINDLPNEILLRIFDNLDSMDDILNLRRCNKKLKSLSEVKLYNIIEGKINALENTKKSLEIRLNHMNKRLRQRLSHYKFFLNVISRSDVTELCNLPNPPREVKYIFSVLYILYTGGNNCQCSQCIENKNRDSTTTTTNNYKKIISRYSFSVSNLNVAKTISPSNIDDENNNRSTNCNSNRRNSFNDFTSINLGKRKNSFSSDEDTSFHSDKKSYNTTSAKTINCNSSSSSNDIIVEKIKKEKEMEKVIDIPNWEEVHQIIGKEDFRNWVINLHSNLDIVPKEHILLADKLLNKPRTTPCSESSSNGDSITSSEYDNLRLTYDRMLIVSQIGYKILLFIEAIIQSFNLTESFKEQKKSVSLVYKQIHQWKDLQLQCKN